jgi:4-hydroxybenzoate polyprenyltransferase
MGDVTTGYGPIWRRLHGAWRQVVSVDRLVRLHFLSFSALWPLLGVATAGRRVTDAELGVLLAVMFCFHVYTMLFNDVVDLPIDRTQPKRQNDPLVRGTMRPWQVLTIALVHAGLMVPLTMWLGGRSQAFAVVGAGVVSMAGYNLWGKRCAFPPLTDAIQGLAWASLVVYAPLAVGSRPTFLTWMVAAYAVVFTLLFNGIHGPLRDLANDYSSGARTTAIFLGARPASGRDPHVPAAVAIYATCVLAGLFLIEAVILVRNDFGYSPFAWIATVMAAAAVNTVIVVLQPKFVRPRGREWEAVFRLHLFLVMISLPVVFLAHMSAQVLFVLLMLNALALALFGWTPAVVRWALDAIGSTTARPANGKGLATRVLR